MEKSQKEILMGIRDNLLKILDHKETIMEEFEKLVRYLVDNEDILNIMSEKYDTDFASYMLCRCIFNIFENEIKVKSHEIFPVFSAYDDWEGDIEEYESALKRFEEMCIWAFNTNAVTYEEEKGLSDIIKCFRSYIDYIVDLEDESLIDSVNSFIRSIINLIYDMVMDE